MIYLFYTEGHSEYNFIKKFFISRGILFTEDIGEIEENPYYLKNCKGRSSIYSDLKSDRWWIEDGLDALLVMVADTDGNSCYSSFNKEARGKLEKIGINKGCKIIALRPKMEQIYLENKELLKYAITSYCNRRMTNKEVEKI